MRYAISYGNGNDGLSRMHAAFTVEAPEGSEFLVARLAMVSQFSASGRRFANQKMSVDEAGPNGAQAVIYDPPGSIGWSEHNGAWRLADAYDASEITNDPHHYESLEAAFGRQLVAAQRKREG